MTSVLKKKLNGLEVHHLDVMVDQFNLQVLESCPSGQQFIYLQTSFIHQYKAGHTGVFNSVYPMRNLFYDASFISLH